MKIGVLGYNQNLTKEALVGIAKSDVDARIIKISSNEIVMSDGTSYIPATRQTRGLRFDQIILVDDYRWELLTDEFDFINDILLPSLINSCVPEDFQVIQYEW